MATMAVYVATAIVGAMTRLLAVAVSMRAAAVVAWTA
jgi:hypothetical protein